MADDIHLRIGNGAQHRVCVLSWGAWLIAHLVDAGYPQVQMCIRDRDMGSYCNQALDSILPGMVGIEAGQAAFGDLFSWLKRVMMWPVKQMGMEDIALESLDKQFFPALEREAGARKSVQEAVGIDWFNGRRYPDIKSNNWTKDDS